MKFVIVGAGATGGYLGALLARTGEDVTLIARGPHLAAMRDHGVRVREAGEEWSVRPECTDDGTVLQTAEVCLLTLKAHSLAGVAPRLRELLGPDTAVLPAQNGIPWWYFQQYGGPLEGTQLTTLDPDGVLAECLEVRRLLGCVVWPATRLVEPGVVEHIEGNRFTIGELNGERTARATAIAECLNRAGLKCRVSRRIRNEIWTKLLGNAVMNPLSALTRATLVRIATLPETRALARDMMAEAALVAEALGAPIDVSVERRLEMAEAVGEHRSSMLQDVESGRPLEVEALLGVIVELGELLGIATPCLRTVYACVKLLDQTLRGTAKVGARGGI
ncbi:MAG: 2-dehydropantoate 2-reductase [Armatimonadetes bacterium]|nr:2-dehydropantoate 2-reductase [Armatimonadota bacterium]